MVPLQYHLRGGHPAVKKMRCPGPDTAQFGLVKETGFTLLESMRNSGVKGKKGLL